MINLNDKQMHVVETAQNGVVNHQTVFSFGQKKDQVFARYQGGPVSRGMLVGRINGSFLHFHFVQEHADGEISGGESTCEIAQQIDGKVMLVEHFDWDRGTGQNIFRELD